jgi:hypothetical protein
MKYVCIRALGHLVSNLVEYNALDLERELCYGRGVRRRRSF